MCRGKSTPHAASSCLDLPQLTQIISLRFAASHFASLASARAASCNLRLAPPRPITLCLARLALPRAASVCLAPPRSASHRLGLPRSASRSSCKLVLPLIASSRLKAVFSAVYFLPLSGVCRLFSAAIRSAPLISRRYFRCPVLPIVRVY